MPFRGVGQLIKTHTHLPTQANTHCMYRHEYIFINKYVHACSHTCIYTHSHLHAHLHSYISHMHVRIHYCKPHDTWMIQKSYIHVNFYIEISWCIYARCYHQGKHNWICLSVFSTQACLGPLQWKANNFFRTDGPMQHSNWMHSMVVSLSLHWTVRS